MRNGTMQRSRARGGLRLVDSRPSAVPRRSSRPTAADDGRYYTRIQDYAQRIRRTDDVGDIIALLEEALRETRALHTADEVAVARQRLVAAERNIERLKCELELVNQLVREDQLTGALNRRGLDDALAREAARADRNVAPLCIALIDLDNFKNLNDRFGHQAGDCALVHLVAMVRDVVRSHDFIGRYGGEEFMLVLPASRIEEGATVVKRLQQALAARPLVWDGAHLPLTFSAGVAERSHGEKEPSLIGRADAAMYQAKRMGKDRTVVAP
jgi:diguanylate cyclase